VAAARDDQVERAVQPAGRTPVAVQRPQLQRRHQTIDSVPECT
jgi:hypothetical protein